MPVTSNTDSIIRSPLMSPEIVGWW